ncbi:hypothetical protein Glove_235g25 [Diversispora epigaea]|uniref:Uncharacterized protein n=1 Tax=Diversispora epigaea TaxID=1348612 RepID=A0A397IDX1_9GLOM|nr:hypothetical protein Glove_235g25 [Diversispora epigaea]
MPKEKELTDFERGEIIVKYMFNWHAQQRLQQFHNIFHTAPNRLNQYQRNNFHQYQDPSCTLCSPPPALLKLLAERDPNQIETQIDTLLKTLRFSPPPALLSARFLVFRNWLELLAERDPNQIETQIDTLLKTLRFRNNLLTLLINCLHYTQGFTVNLEQLNNLQNLDIPTNTDATDETEEIPPEPVDNMAMNQQTQRTLVNLFNRIVQQQT